MRSLPLGLALAGLGLAACAGPDDGAAPCEQCDDVADEDVPVTPCDGTVIDRSGRSNPDGTPIKRVVGRLGDPLAKLVYGSPGGCPTTYADIMAKLAQVDAADCVDDGFSARAGVATRLISETAALEGATGGPYRAVTTRVCGGRPDFGLFFSLFGVRTAAAALPRGVEIAAFDESAGVFNYYKEVGGRMAFFGDSLELVTKGPGGPGVTDVRGCANCHTGGGPIMKELSSPWLHWKGAETVPGSEALFAAHPNLGLESSGISMEGTTRAANRTWNATRIARLRETGTVAELLEPLFCPVEVNVTNGNSLVIPTSLLMDEGLGRVGLALFGPESPDTIFDELERGYRALTTAIGQSVPGHPGKTDTISPFGYVERSGADQAYVEQLIAAGVIDRAFARDVLMVDFTRPVFSDPRCDLLRFAPTLPAAERTPEAIRRGFLDALVGAAPGSEAAQLRGFLAARDPARPVRHAFAVRSFEKACAARTGTVQVGGEPVRELLIDALKLRSLGRKIGFGDGELDELRGSARHPRPVFEFADTLATDRIVPTTTASPAALDQVHPEARLSPTTCELVSTFEPVVPAEVASLGDCSTQDHDGICVDTTTVACPLPTVAGLCPGAATVQCCPLEPLGFDGEGE